MKALRAALASARSEVLASVSSSGLMSRVNLMCFFGEIAEAELRLIDIMVVVTVFWGGLVCTYANLGVPPGH